jgi:hypothetical protein
LFAKTPPCGPPGKAAILTPSHHFAVGSVANVSTGKAQSVTATEAIIVRLKFLSI